MRVETSVGLCMLGSPVQCNQPCIGPARPPCSSCRLLSRLCRGSRQQRHACSATTTAWHETWCIDPSWQGHQSVGPWNYSVRSIASYAVSQQKPLICKYNVMHLLSLMFCSSYIQVFACIWLACHEFLQSNPDLLVCWWCMLANSRIESGGHHKRKD